MDAATGPQDFIDELTANVARKDAIKAQVLLESCAGLDDNTLRRLAYELSKADDAFAATLLGRVACLKPAALNANPHLAHVLAAKMAACPAAMEALLGDASIPCKTPLHILAARLQLPQAAEWLGSALAAATRKDDMLQLLKALGELGDPSTINAISEHLYSRDMEIVLEAVDALARLGTSAAIQRLAERMGGDRVVDERVARAFAAIQTPAAIEKLRDGLLSAHASTRNLCKSMLVSLGPKAVPVLIQNLGSDDTDLLIHSLNALGAIGDPTAAAPVRKLIQAEPRDANVRFAAYEALGLLPPGRGAYTLAAGLGDPDQSVRVAAAKAVAKNYDDILSAGLRNLLRDAARSPARMVEALLDAEASEPVLDLLDDDFFRKYALAYLKSKAHADVRRHFEDLFRARGRADLADAIRPQAAAAADPPAGRLAFAVDDSIMILRVYRSSLHALGYESELFEFPENALRRMAERKPDIVLTDLNMPGMSGVELAARVQSLFGAAAPPVVMVTTQGESGDTEAAREAGVVEVLRKPFTQESLSAAMARAMASRPSRGGPSATRKPARQTQRSIP